MSSFQVSKKHIDTLVYAVALTCYSKPDMVECHRIGAMLTLENAKSVASRYRGHVDESLAHSYRYTPQAGVSVVVMLKAVACYQYQAGDHEGWERSKAKELCDSLTKLLIQKLPGYDAAPWGID